ncbi:MAG: hypothetical protein AB7N91_10620 [Candidatus Tectimicrobiota bacterium]
MLIIGKTRRVLLLVTACLFMLASVTCLVHLDGSDGTQASPDGHDHTSSSSSPHSMSDVYCLAATLPARIVLAGCSIGIVCLLTQVSLPVVFAFPPFIPPKILLPVALLAA